MSATPTSPAGCSTRCTTPNSVRVLPFLIDQLSRGNTAPILPLAQRNVDFARLLHGGARPVGRLRRGGALQRRRAHRGGARGGSDPGALRGRARASARTARRGLSPRCRRSRTRPSRASIPTLIMNGGYDPVTPLAYGEAAAVRLSMHYLYEFPTMGHGSVWANWVDECPASIAEQFLSDPDGGAGLIVHRRDAADRLPHDRRHLPDDGDLPIQQTTSSRTATRSRSASRRSLWSC